MLRKKLPEDVVQHVQPLERMSRSHPHEPDHRPALQIEFPADPLPACSGMEHVRIHRVGHEDDVLRRNPKFLEKFGDVQRGYDDRVRSGENGSFHAYPQPTEYERAVPQKIVGFRRVDLEKMGQAIPLGQVCAEVREGAIAFVDEFRMLDFHELLRSPPGRKIVRDMRRLLHDARSPQRMQKTVLPRT